MVSQSEAGAGPLPARVQCGRQAGPVRQVERCTQDAGAGSQLDLVIVQAEPLNGGLIEDEVVLNALNIESRSIIDNIYLPSLISDFPWIPLGSLGRV